MSALQRFDFRGEQLRCSMVAGEPQFVAADVARALGYSATAAMTRYLEDDEKGVSDWQTPGGKQQLATVNESGLYSAVFRSSLPMARDFKRWVTREVLPAIRATGSYSVPAHPSTVPVPALELTQEQQVLALAHQVIDQAARLEIAAPKVDAFDELMDSTGLYSVEQVAKATGYGRNVLFRELRNLGVLQGNNLPYQRHMHHFEIKVGVRQNRAGQTIPTYTTWVRPSGVDYIRKRLTKSRQDIEASMITDDLSQAAGDRADRRPVEPFEARATAQRPT